MVICNLGRYFEVLSETSNVGYFYRVRRYPLMLPCFPLSQNQLLFCRGLPHPLEKAEQFCNQQPPS